MNNVIQLPISPEAKNESPEIVVGRRVLSQLYGGRFGIIYKIEGTPDAASCKTHFGGVMVTGGGCRVDIVLEDGSLTKRLPEAILRGVQWRIRMNDPLATPEETQEALEFAEATIEKNRREKEAAAVAFQQRITELRSDPEYAHFAQSDSDTALSCSKLAAKNIRVLLKRKFKDVKFSVRRSSYSNIWVTWPKEADGDTVNQRSVLDLLSCFKTGHYNVMEDYHSNDDRPFNKVFGGVQYLTAQRDL